MPIDTPHDAQRRREVAEIVALYRDLAPEDQVTVLTLVAELLAARRRAAEGLPQSVQ